MPGSILRASRDALARFKAEGAELRREGFEGAAAEPAEGDGGGDIDHAHLAGHSRSAAVERARVRSFRAGRPHGRAGRSTGRGPVQRGGRAQHVLDGADAGDRFLGKRKRHGDGAGEFAIDIDRAAAHSLHDAGLLQRPARESRKDEGFLGADIIQDAEDFDLEFVDAVAGEYGASDPVHAGPDVL